MSCLFIFSLFFSSNTLSKTIAFDTNVEGLYKVLKERKVNNLKEAILLLNTDFFGADQYALIFNSRSIQPSSPQFPRILLFGKDKKMRLGFNHNFKQSKRSLEILQFREKTSLWELREIKFTEKGVQLSEKNPSLCISCHGDKEIKPEFENHLSRRLLQTGKKLDLSKFQKLRKRDPIFKNLKRLPNYLESLK